MKLSVIVPVYNTKDYLKTCIESVLRQSFREIELLLIDDGSTDGSGGICDQYAGKDARVRVFHKDHGGPVSSRKMGVENAGGNYITFVDADDFISELSYELALEDMQKGIDVIVFDIIRYFGKDNIHVSTSKYKEGIYDTENIRRSILPDMIWDIKNDIFGMDPSLCSKILRRELLKDQYCTINDVNIHYGEDVAVIYPLILQVDTLSIHHKAYYYHRQRETGNMAPYLTDSLFFDKLYILYRHLRKEVGENSVLRRQIELFYIHSVMLRGNQYGKVWMANNRIFPFDRVKKGEKIILYGAGNLGSLYKAQLSLIDYCKVLFWVDKNYKFLSEKGVSSPESIVGKEFDKLVIAIEDKKICGQVKCWLQKEGVKPDKVVY